MSTATNSITGDKIQTKTSTEAYRNNFDAIFRKDKKDVLKSDQPIKEEVQNETSKS